MNFKGIQKTFNYMQTNHGNINEVFPLLCPVMEKEWLDGWEYDLIHSESGIIEKDCVFTTPLPNGEKTVWQVTHYSRQTFTIEFVRVTPGENIVKINIQLEPIDVTSTKSLISYQYTSLNESQNEFIVNDLPSQFIDSMEYWNKAINHYLMTGTLLKRKK